MITSDSPHAASFGGVADRVAAAETSARTSAETPISSVRRTRSSLRDRLDDFDQLFAAVPVPPRELHELPRVHIHRPLLRSAAHGDAPTTPEFEQPLVAQVPERTQDGVAIDAE